MQRKPGSKMVRRAVAFPKEWKELEKDVTICSGNRSQSHKKFSGRNRQSAAASVVACAFAALRSMPTWTRDVLDEILEIGTNLHLRSRQMSDNRCLEYLTPLHVYKYFFWKNLKISMRVGVDTIVGKLPRDSTLLEKVGGMLDKLFEKYSSGVFGHQRSYFAVWKFDKYFFIFDPTEHSLDGGRWDGLPGLGYCCCIRTTSTKTLAEVIIKNCPIRTIYRFIIYPCILEKYIEINTKPPERLEDVVPLPLEGVTKSLNLVKTRTIPAPLTSVSVPDSVPVSVPESVPASVPVKHEDETLKPEIPTSRVPPVRTKLPSVTNFTTIAKGKILRASTHQRDPNFTKYMGAQAMGNALAALTMLRQYKSKFWIRKILDDVLKLGEHVYHDMKKFGDIPKKITWNEKEYSPKVDKYGAIGRLESDDDKILSLDEAVKDSLIDTDCCVLDGPNVVAIWKEDGKYYMFDPEERDSSGRRVTSGQGGVACLTSFVRSEDLVALYLSNIPKSSLKDRFMLSKVAIEDYSPIAEDWNSFKALTHNKWILRGNFSQQDRRFPVESRNAQCTAMSTMALTYKEMKEEKDWDSQVVDQVLLNGDELYRSCVSRLEETGRFKNKYLMVDEIKRNFDLENKRVILEIDDCLVNGVINAKSDTGIPNLRRGFERFFRDSEAGIVTANLQSMAVWKRDDTYYYYDSHSRDAGGVVCAYGTACVLRLVTVEDLTDALTRNMGADPLNLYNISRVVVKLLDITEDGAVRPPLNLFEAVDDLVAILRSNSSCRDGKFEIRAGKQGVPMCLAALALNAVAPSCEWNREDVDQVLTFGDGLYVESMEANIEEDIEEVSTNNVKNEMKIGANKFEFEMEEISSGNVQNNLEASIESWKEIEENNAILESQYVTASIWRDDNLYYLFDPNPRNEKGETYGSDEWGFTQEEDEAKEEDEENDKEDENEEEDVYGDEMGGGDFVGGSEEVVALNTYDEANDEEEEEDEEETNEEEEEESPDVVERKGSAYWRQKEEEEGKACVLRFSRLEDLIRNVLKKTPPNKREETEFTLKSVKINNTPVIREIFNPESEEKEDEIKGDWNEFREIDYGKWILQSGRSFNDGLFPVNNRGKQGVPMCVVALAFASLYAMEKFNQDVVDGIVAYGDRLYTLLGKLRAKELKARKDLSLNDEEIEEILKNVQYRIPEYPKRIVMGDKLAKWDVKLEAICGDVTSNIPESVPNVLSGLTTFFDENNFGILESRNYAVSVWKHGDFYFMFDPHPNGPSGVRSPVGVSCITRFKELEDLVNLFLSNLPLIGDNFFEIHSFTFTSEDFVRERHPEVKAEKIARVGGFSSVMAGKEILRGELKLDCSKFQRGVNIHSAPIAYVALALSLAKRPNTWTRLIVDEILRLGEELYDESLDKLGDRFNPWADSLDICRVNTDFKIGRLKVNCAIRFTEQRGIVDVKNSKTPNLRQGLERFFEENSHGVLVTDKFALAVWEEAIGDDVSVYLFDPNSRGATGLPGQDGVPCVVKFCNSKVAADHVMACMMDVDKTRTEFSIIPVEVVIGSLRSKRKLCKIPQKEVLVVNEPPTPPPFIEKPVRCPNKTELLNAKRVMRHIAAEERRRHEAKRCHALGRKAMYQINSNEAIVRGIRVADPDRVLPVNIVAFIFMKIATDLDKWTSQQVEIILETGNQLYIDSIVAYNLPYSKLTIQNLLRRLVLNECEVKIEIKKPLVLSTFVREYLSSNLSKFFTIANFCILCYKEQLVSVFFKSGYYYLFDPYSRDLNGNRTEDGSAMLMRFGDLSCLVEKLLRNLEDDQPPERYSLIIPCLLSVEPLKE